MVREVLLEPKKACRYYWKALIFLNSGGRYRVRLFDKYEKPYRSSFAFGSLDEAKIYARRTLLNQ